MTDSTNVTDSASVIAQLATQADQQAKDIISTYGPDAYHMTLEYVFWFAFTNTLSDLVWIVVASVVLFFTIPFVKNAYIETQDLDKKDEFIKVIVGSFATIVASIFLIAGVFDLISPSNILGLFNPKIELINMVLNQSNGR